MVSDIVPQEKDELPRLDLPWRALKGLETLAMNRWSQLVPV